MMSAARLQIGNLLGLLSRRTWMGLASASGWQIANYAIPLLTFPYLARVLGAGGFGILGLGSAIAAYALLMTDWGFTLSATQAVARVRDDPAAINRIVWATISAKAVLGVLSCAVVAAGTYLVVSNPILRAVVIVSLLNVVGSVFSVDWALRGVEQIGKFAAASIAGRLAAVPLVFILVRSADALPQAAFAWSAGAVFTAAITLVMAARAGILRRPTASFGQALGQVKSGLHVFLTTATISLYTNLLTLILGLAANAHEVGLFSAADRIRRPVQGLLSPIAMVFYPRMSFLAVTDTANARMIGLRLLYMQSGIALLLSLGLCLTAPIAVRILLGPEFQQAIAVVQILAWLIFLIAVSNGLGVIIMLPFGLKQEVSYSVLAGAVVGLATSIPLSIMDGAAGTAMAAVLSETAVPIVMYILLRRRMGWFSLWFNRAPIDIKSIADGAE